MSRAFQVKPESEKDGWIFVKSASARVPVGHHLLAHAPPLSTERSTGDATCMTRGTNDATLSALFFLFIFSYTQRFGGCVLDRGARRRNWTTSGGQQNRYSPSPPADRCGQRLAGKDKGARLRALTNERRAPSVGWRKGATPRCAASCHPPAMGTAGQTPRGSPSTHPGTRRVWPT